MKDGGSFRCLGNDGAGSDHVSWFYGDVHIPFFFCVQGVDTDTTGDLLSGIFGDFGKRSLDAIEYIMDNTWSQKYRDRISCSGDGITWL